MKKTGIFLTKDETEEMQNLAHEAATTLGKRMSARLTELAKAHGLPDIAGEYGLTSDGEFVTV
mgnify:CR=1 FL=1